jgi:hypothetical protein
VNLQENVLREIVGSAGSRTMLKMYRRIRG